MRIELGTLVKDKVSGFIGVAENRATYLYGCDRYCVQPLIGKDGKLPDSYMFDEPQLEIVGDQCMKPMPEPKQLHELGKEVYDPIRDMKATVTGRAVYLNGCARLLLEPKIMKLRAKIIDAWWVNEFQVQAIEKKEPEHKKWERGGPNGVSSKY